MRKKVHSKEDVKEKKKNKKSWDSKRLLGMEFCVTIFSF